MDSNTILKIVLILILGLIIYKVYSITQGEGLVIGDGKNKIEIIKPSPKLIPNIADQQNETSGEDLIVEAKDNENTDVPIVDDSDQNTNPEVTEDFGNPEVNPDTSSTDVFSDIEGDPNFQDNYYMDNQIGEGQELQQEQCTQDCNDQFKEYANVDAKWKNKATHLYIESGPKDLDYDKIKDGLRFWVTFQNDQDQNLLYHEPAIVELYVLAVQPGNSKKVYGPIYKALYYVDDSSSIAFMSSNKGLFAFYKTMNLQPIKYETLSNGEEYTSLKVIAKAYTSSTESITGEKVFDVLRNDLPGLE